jgi:3-phosphoshikimate 1-carboxyvinyltransferase
MAGELLVRAQGDLPVLFALAARARGTTEIVGVDELAEVDGFATGTVAGSDMVGLLRAFGVETESTSHDTVVVIGRPDDPLDAADIDAAGNVARATTAVILGLLASGPTRIRRVDVLAGRFPRIVGTLRALGADVRVEARS